MKTKDVLTNRLCVFMDSNYVGEFYRNRFFATIFRTLQKFSKLYTRFESAYFVKSDKIVVEK